MTLDWMASGLCSGRAEWTDWQDVRERDQAAQACKSCPVLAACTSWARQRTWAGVVVAAWVAPDRDPRRRPGRDPPSKPRSTPRTTSRSTRPTRRQLTMNNTDQLDTFPLDLQAGRLVPPVDPATITPESVVAIESDNPDLLDDFIVQASAPDDAWAAIVPEHLRDSYLAVQVPREIAVAAISGKMQTIALTIIDPLETDRETYDAQRRASTPRTPTVKEAIHDWRLNEAARLHADEQRKRATGAYGIDCPACGTRSYASGVVAFTLDNGNVFVGCEACRVELGAELRRIELEADPILTARRAAIATALGQEQTP